MLVRTALISATLLLPSLAGLSALRKDPASSRPGALSGEHLEILEHLSIVYLESGDGEVVKTIRLTGANLQIVNGLGATNGNPSAPYSTDPSDARVNGLGNLILGYHETSTTGNFSRSGSHCLVLGVGNSCTSFAGICSGQNNLVAAPHGAALGGSQNRVVGSFAVALGGLENEVRGVGAFAAAGELNLASGSQSAVLGSARSLAAGRDSSVSGGYKSFAMGDLASVSGGALNQAVGNYSVVSGGRNRSATEDDNWVAGSLLESN